MASKKFRKKVIIGGGIATIYILCTLIATIKFLLQQSNSYKELWLLVIPFILGLAIFLAPAETLLRFDRQTGYFLYKIAPNEEAGFGCAGMFYTLFGLIFMLFPMAVILSVLFVKP